MRCLLRTGKCFRAKAMLEPSVLGPRSRLLLLGTRQVEIDARPWRGDLSFRGSLFYTTRLPFISPEPEGGGVRVFAQQNPGPLVRDRRLLGAHCAAPPERPSAPQLLLPNPGSPSHLLQSPRPPRRHRPARSSTPLLLHLARFPHPSPHLGDLPSGFSKSDPGVQTFSARAGRKEDGDPWSTPRVRDREGALTWRCSLRSSRVAQPLSAPYPRALGTRPGPPPPPRAGKALAKLPVAAGGRAEGGGAAGALAQTGCARSCSCRRHPRCRRACRLPLDPPPSPRPAGHHMAWPATGSRRKPEAAGPAPAPPPPPRRGFPPPTWSPPDQWGRPEPPSGLAWALPEEELACPHLNGACSRPGCGSGCRCPAAQTRVALPGSAA